MGRRETKKHFLGFREEEKWLYQQVGCVE